MYDVNVLVNGSRCKQYNHDGKVFIEAKHGSEYTIEIKNNTWARILAVCSVDGLNILNGKTAEESNPGYVINQLASSKFDGFRVSNEKVAKFVFSTKDASYAADKGDNSEKNVGVIGIRLFTEKVKPLPKVTEIHHHHNHWRRPRNDWGTPVPPYNPPIIWCDTTYSTSTDGPCGCSNGADDACLDFMGDLGAGSRTYSSNNIPTKGGPSDTMGKKRSSAGGQSAGAPRGLIDGPSLRGRVTAQNATFMSNTMKSAEPLRGFDMGTKWGEAKESRVTEVEFEKGVLALTTNIYYASRQSLLEMGVPLGNEKQVSFPEPFKETKYSQPPKNWKG